VRVAGAVVAIGLLLGACGEDGSAEPSMQDEEGTAVLTLGRGLADHPRDVPEGSCQLVENTGRIQVTDAGVTYVVHLSPGARATSYPETGDDDLGYVEVLEPDRSWISGDVRFQIADDLGHAGSVTGDIVSSPGEQTKGFELSWKCEGMTPTPDGT